MRCPACHDEYEPHVTHCADCGLELRDGDDPGPPPPAVPDTRLGRFHPLAAEAVLALATDRGVAVETVTRDREVEVLVERDWRDDLRAELALTWHDVLARLPEERRDEVRARGGEHPGWSDPPRGGWVDREGRMVVDVDDDPDQARVVGPAMAVGGGVLVVLAWYAGMGGGMVAAGLALVLLGLLLPR